MVDHRSWRRRLRPRGHNGTNRAGYLGPSYRTTLRQSKRNTTRNFIAGPPPGVLDRAGNNMPLLCDRLAQQLGVR